MKSTKKDQVNTTVRMIPDYMKFIRKTDINFRRLLGTGLHRLIEGHECPVCGNPYTEPVKRTHYNVSVPSDYLEHCRKHNINKSELATALVAMVAKEYICSFCYQRLDGYQDLFEFGVIADVYDEK